jgi:hypothetical protein
MRDRFGRDEMRRIQVQHKDHPRRDDPGRVLPLDPRDQDVLRAKQSRSRTDLPTRNSR